MKRKKFAYSNAQVIQALRASGGDVGGAAKALGVNVSTLRGRVKRDVRLARAAAIIREGGPGVQEGGLGVLPLPALEHVRDVIQLDKSRFSFKGGQLPGRVFWPLEHVRHVVEVDRSRFSFKG